MDEMAIYLLIYWYAIRRQKHLNQFQARNFCPLIIVDFGRRVISKNWKLQVSLLSKFQSVSDGLWGRQSIRATLRMLHVQQHQGDDALRSQMETAKEKAIEKKSLFEALLLSPVQVGFHALLEAWNSLRHLP